MSPMVHQCADCGGERLFEQPHEVPGSCPGSPGDPCREWACTECGAALLAPLWPVPVQLAPRPAVVGQVA